MVMEARRAGVRVPVALLVLVILSGWSGVFSEQQPLKEITFLTNYVFIGRHAPFFVGLEKGFYRDAGFDIDILPATGSTFVVSALEGGQADYGIAEAASLVQAIGQGASVTAFGVFMDESTSGLASLAPYPTPRRITGKRVAASLTDSARVILPSVLSQARLDPSGVEWLAADPGIYFSLLLSGRADLVTASIDSDVPTLKRVVEPRGRTVHFSSFAEWGYDVYGYFLVTQAERIVSEPEDIRAFAAATASAVTYAVEHPVEAASIMARHSPTVDDAMALAHWQESIKAIRTRSVEENGYGLATTERLQRSINFVAQAFDLRASPTPSDVYADGFMPR